MKWITALDLERWAASIGSRQDLAELLGSLIRARAKEIAAYRFPSGDFAQLPAMTACLRQRLRLLGSRRAYRCGSWVLGTIPRKRPGEDYDSRTRKPRNVTPAETTFVFVTPRPWRDQDKKKQWIDERKSRRLGGYLRCGRNRP